MQYLSITDPRDPATFCSMLHSLEKNIGVLQDYLQSRPSSISTNLMLDAREDISQAEVALSAYTQRHFLDLQTARKVAIAVQNTALLENVCKGITSSSNTDNLMRKIREKLEPEKKWKRKKVAKLARLFASEEEDLLKAGADAAQKAIQKLISNIDEDIDTVETTFTAPKTSINNGTGLLYRLSRQKRTLAVEITKKLLDDDLIDKAKNAIGKAEECLDLYKSILETAKRGGQDVNAVDEAEQVQEGLDKIDEWRWTDPEISEYHFDQLP